MKIEKRGEYDGVPEWARYINNGTVVIACEGLNSGEDLYSLDFRGPSDKNRVIMTEPTPIEIRIPRLRYSHAMDSGGCHITTEYFDSRERKIIQLGPQFSMSFLSALETYLNANVLEVSTRGQAEDRIEAILAKVPTLEIYEYFIYCARFHPHEERTEVLFNLDDQGFHPNPGLNHAGLVLGTDDLIEEVDGYRVIDHYSGSLQMKSFKRRSAKEYKVRSKIWVKNISLADLNQEARALFNGGLIDEAKLRQIVNFEVVAEKSE